MAATFGQRNPGACGARRIAESIGLDRNFSAIHGNNAKYRDFPGIYRVTLKLEPSDQLTMTFEATCDYSRSANAAWNRCKSFAASANIALGGTTASGRGCMKT